MWVKSRVFRSVREERAETIELSPSTVPLREMRYFKGDR
jgi:hypothetical protein